MRFRVSVALAAVTSAALAADVVPAVERTVGGRVIDVCQAWAIPSSAVGKLIAIRGRVHSDAEASWVYGDACHDTMIRLTYAPTGPSLVGCIAGNGDPRCGGIWRSEQVAVVTGMLKVKAMGSRARQGLPLAAGEVQVVGFQVVE